MAQVSVDFSKPIPLFPLPGAVLLPHGAMPLHIFEPRYRAMVQDALDGPGLIAMAIVDEEDWTDGQAAPPLRPAVGLGVIAQHQQLPDGRYHLVLQGLARATIDTELDRIECDTPYRQAMLQPIDEPTMEIDLDEHRRRLTGMMTRPPLDDLVRVGAINQWLTDEIGTAALVDVCIGALVQEAEQRYAMLAEGDASARAAWLTEYLTQIARSIELAERVSKSISEDGLFLN